MQVREFWCVKTHPTFYSKDCFVNSILAPCNASCLAKTCCCHDGNKVSWDFSMCVKTHTTYLILIFFYNKTIIILKIVLYKYRLLLTKTGFFMTEVLNTIHTLNTNVSNNTKKTNNVSKNACTNTNNSLERTPSQDMINLTNHSKEDYPLSVEEIIYYDMGGTRGRDELDSILRNLNEENYTILYDHNCIFYNSSKETAFLASIIKNMSKEKLIEVINEIENLYKSLPPKNDNDQISQRPNPWVILRLIMLKQSNIDAYKYILENPNKSAIAILLKRFSRLQITAFSTLNLPQIYQIQGIGRTNGEFYTNKYSNNDHFTNCTDPYFRAEYEFVGGVYGTGSANFYNKPDLVSQLHEYYSKQEITEDFTAYRAERDTGIFDNVILDKSMQKKLKFMALKNVLKARKIKINEYSRSYIKCPNTNLFSYIMNKKDLTLADAMQMMKFGNNKFKDKIIEQIQSTKICDNRFKSLTFDKEFASYWNNRNSGGQTKIIENMHVNKGLHGAYSSQNNDQAEFILDNEDKEITFSNVKYDSQKDVFYIDSEITPVK